MSSRILGIILAGTIMTTLGACKTVRNADELQTHLSEVTVAASSYGFEMRDEGVEPRETIKTSAYHSTTPLTAAGVATVATAQVVEMLRGRPPVLLDVLGGSGHATIPGAHWLPGAGTGKDFGDQTQARLGSRLAELTGGDKDRPLVIFCLSYECWLSYNTSLRASLMGYKNVHWYRGGVQSWKAAGLPTTSAVKAW